MVLVSFASVGTFLERAKQEEIARRHRLFLEAIQGFIDAKVRVLNRCTRAEYIACGDPPQFGPYPAWAQVQLDYWDEQINRMQKAHGFEA